MTVAAQVTTFPVGLTAVPVNVVSPVMAFEVVEPLFAGVTLPMPWSIVNVSAFVVVQVSFVWSPEETVVGLALSVHETPCGGMSVTVVWQWTVPPAPVAVPM